MSISIIFDLAIIAVLAFLIIRGYKSGLIKSAFRPKKIYSIVFAILYYKKLGDYIGDKYVYPYLHGKIEDAMTEKIAQTAQEKNISSASLLESIPDFVKRVADLCGVNLTDMANSAAESVENAINTFVEGVAKFCTSAISIIVAFIIIYLGGKIALVIIEKILDFIFKERLLDKVNKIGGLFFGVISAFVFGTFLSIVIGYGVPALGTSISALSGFDVEKTFVIKFFFHFNILKVLL